MPINSTPGDAAADSYVSLAEAGAYFSAAFNRQVWSTLDETLREGLLKSSTRYIDQFMKFYGSKSSSTQSLKFPRIGCYDEESNPIPADAIPNRLKQAVMELAWHLQLVGDLRFSGSTRNRLKVAVIDIQFKTTGNDLGIPDYIENMMSAFGESDFQGGGSIKTIKLERA